jgi:hypothetical protein
MGHLGAALGRALVHILISFFVAAILVALAIELAFYLVNNGQVQNGGVHALAIVFGIIIGIIIGFVTLLIEIVHGIRAVGREVQGEIGKADQALHRTVDSSIHHHEPS